MRFNPNLYNCGKVCLSLLGTWSGTAACEKWSPTSTLLQVCLILFFLRSMSTPHHNMPNICLSRCLCRFKALFSFARPGTTSQGALLPPAKWIRACCLTKTVALTTSEPTRSGGQWQTLQSRLLHRFRRWVIVGLNVWANWPAPRLVGNMQIAGHKYCTHSGAASTAFQFFSIECYLNTNALLWQVTRLHLALRQARINELAVQWSGQLKQDMSRFDKDPTYSSYGSPAVKAMELAVRTGAQSCGCQQFHAYCTQFQTFQLLGPVTVAQRM